MGSTSVEEARAQIGKTVHMMVIPYPTQGHIFSALWFARMVARHAVTISVVGYEDTISLLTSNSSTFDFEGLDFRFLSLRKHEKAEYKGHRMPPHENAKLFREAFEPLLQQLRRDKSAGVDVPDCILSDMFQNWSQDVADELRIPRYLFVPSGASLVRLQQAFWGLLEGGLIRVAEEEDGKLAKFDSPISIPGLPSLRYHELPSTARIFPAQFLYRSNVTWRAQGVVVNSFYEAEPHIIDSFRTCEHPKLGPTAVAPKIFPVGPLLSMSGDSANAAITDGELEDSATRALGWLDKQPHASVLYVAFGSVERLSPENVRELALGLETSGQRFLWVIPESKASSKEGVVLATDSLPSGYEARLGGRACIVTGWVPQVKILAHGSTGAFLTHCGWNSSLESMIMGVPMVGWPQGAEQHLNCRHLVDQLKIAEEIQTGPQNVLHRKEAERAVRLVMVEAEGKEILRRIQDLRRQAAEAVAEDGSQYKAFQHFMNDIRIGVH